MYAGSLLSGSKFTPLNDGYCCIGKCRSKMKPSNDRTLITLSDGADDEKDGDEDCLVVV